MQESDVPQEERPQPRDRSNEQPRLSLSLPHAEMAALRRRAERLGLTPQEVIQEALRRVDPSPPVSACFPILVTVRRRIEDLQRDIDPVAKSALECFATHRDATKVLTALGKVHAELVRIAQQLDQGVL